MTMNIEELAEQQRLFHSQVVNAFQGISARLENLAYAIPALRTNVLLNPVGINNENDAFTHIPTLGANINAAIHGSLHISGVVRIRVPASTTGAGFIIGYRPNYSAKSPPGSGQTPALYGTVTKDVETFAYYHSLPENNTDAFEITQHEAIYAQDQIVTVVLDLHLVGPGIVTNSSQGLCFKATSDIIVTVLEGSRLQITAHGA